MWLHTGRAHRVEHRGVQALDHQSSRPGATRLSGLQWLSLTRGRIYSAAAQAAQETAADERAGVSVAVVEAAPHAAVTQAADGKQPAHEPWALQLPRASKPAAPTDAATSSTSSSSSTAASSQNSRSSRRRRTARSAWSSGSSHAPAAEAAADEATVPAAQDPHAAAHAAELAGVLNISSERASWLLTSQPVMADMAPLALRRQLDTLGDAVSVGSTSLLASAAAKQPALLTTPAPALQAHITTLARALPVPTARLAKAALRRPELLQLTPAAAAERLVGAAEALGVSRSRAASLVPQQPSLLLMAPADISARVAAMAEALQCTQRQAALLVVAEPGLLSAAPASLAAKLAALGRALPMRIDRACALVRAAPGVLEYSVESIEARVGALRALLGPGRLKAMLWREPWLLTRSGHDVAAKLDSLEGLLGLERTALLDLVLRRPALLTRSTGRLSAAWRALSVWHFSPEYKTELLEAHPTLLRVAPRELYGRCHWLKELMARDAYYHSTLRRVPPKILGVVLMRLPKCFTRFEYMVESENKAGNATCNLMDVVQSSPEAFNALFPEFEKWCSWGPAGDECQPPWREQAQAKQPPPGAHKVPASRPRHRQHHKGAALARHRRRQEQQQQQVVQAAVAAAAAGANGAGAAGTTTSSSARALLAMAIKPRPQRPTARPAPAAQPAGGDSGAAAAP